jgi:hypothetical protein
MKREKTYANYSERKRRETQCKTHASALITQIRVGYKTRYMSVKLIVLRQKTYARKKKGERRKNFLKISYFFVKHKFIIFYY